jgi:hypothetical protein
VKIFVVTEFEFHELCDIKLFSSEEKANEYKNKRIIENDEIQKSRDFEVYSKHQVGLRIDIEEQEVL